MVGGLIGTVLSGMFAGSVSLEDSRHQFAVVTNSGIMQEMAVLIGSINTSEVDSIVVLGQDGEDFRAVSKFASLVHDNLLMGDVRRIAGKPAVKQVDGGFLDRQVALWIWRL